jgi:heme exporter protein A
MLELINLSCRRGERLLFTRLNMVMPPGKVVAVMGSNGSGKTSLLRMLCGLVPPEEGHILWKGQAIDARRAFYAGQLLYIGHLNGLTGDLTAAENVVTVARLCGDDVKEADARAALAAIGLPARVHDLPIRILSQGQQRRTALARVWLSTRPLWILDEPFAFLDEAATRCLTQHLQAHVTGGGTVVMATHEEVAVGPEHLQRMRLSG